MSREYKHRATRGNGLLEPFLARKRCDMARSLLKPAGRIERVLDIGCGAYPLLLKSLDAAERLGIDRVIDEHIRTECARDGIALISHDIARECPLPFPGDHFDAVTMLAVVEHIPSRAAARLAEDVRRILRPGGRFAITTPAAWTGVILRAMAHLSLVSAEEIEEHMSLFTRAGLAGLLQQGGFGNGQIQTGAFEAGMNLWAYATK